MDPDFDLLERWRSGDAAGGQALFARHFKPVYRFFRYKVGADADELVQRTFLACMNARDQFRGESPFRSYLFAIARRELYGYLRARPAAEHVDFGVTSIAEIVTSPSQRLDRARQIDHLREALRRLPVDQQVLLELHYWHEFDAAALANIMGAEPGTIRVRLLRARRALRGAMSRLPPGDLHEIANDRLALSLRESDLDGTAAKRMAG